MLSERARFGLESILLTPERHAALAEVIAAANQDAPIYLAGKPVMSALAGFPFHRGVLAVGLRGPEPDAAALIPPPPRPAIVVALVGLTNHDNVGGIFRNAAAFGADALLLDGESCDPLYRKAIRVSAGAALTVPFARLPDAGAILDLAQEQDLVPLALVPGAQEDVGRLDWPERALLLLGSEGPGLPASVTARCQPVGIAMVPGFDSLNVATAGAVALHRLFEARRQSARDNRQQLSAPG